MPDLRRGGKRPFHLRQPLRPAQRRVDDGKNLLRVNRLFQTGVSPQIQGFYPGRAVGKSVRGQKVGRRVAKAVYHKLQKGIRALKVQVQQQKGVDMRLHAEDGVLHILSKRRGDAMVRQYRAHQFRLVFS